MSRSTVVEQVLPFLNNTEIRPIKKLTGGDCGENWLCLYRGQKIVVKYIKDANQTFLDEVALWTDLGHDNICPIIGLTKNPSTGLNGLVSVFQENGSLTNFLQKNSDRLSLDHRIQMGIQIAEGLGWLHGKTFAIAHLDLKPDNGVYFFLSGPISGSHQFLRKCSFEGSFGISLRVLFGILFGTFSGSFSGPFQDPFWIS
eukprot:TRINITY_DN250_c0_g2_i10.p1 TRINITY_DN250_c0_g2~~TRINITY_DN250_c0_g2_i10.p1  ORF type:complete len:200 (+),score=38.36 TRINITY_DN250_c0_g2_i10:605-1204(+)